MNLLQKLFNRDPWEYGVCKGQIARRHRMKGNVQFVLWPSGQQGHKEDYWHDFDSSWWPQFQSNVGQQKTK